MRLLIVGCAAHVAATASAQAEPEPAAVSLEVSPDLAPSDGDSGGDPAMTAISPQTEPEVDQEPSPAELRKAARRQALDDTQFLGTKDVDPGDPFGDEADALREGMFSARVLLQTRYTHTWATASENPRPSYAVREDFLMRQDDGWELSRAFLRLTAEPSDTLRFRIILNAAELVDGGIRNTVKQAYIRWRPFGKRFEFRAGLFKQPFSMIELDAIRNFELTDTGRLNDLTKDLRFGGRDVGMHFMFAPLAKPRYLRIWVGAFRGNAENENASPVGAVGGRIETRPIKAFRWGVGSIVHPHDVSYKRPFNTSRQQVLPSPPDPLFPAQRDFSRGAAAGTDMTLEAGKFSIRGEAMLGNRVDVFTRGDARTWAAAWFLASYRFRLGALGLMPAVRGEWLDADRENHGGGRRMYTAGLNLLLSKLSRLMFDVTYTDVEPGSPRLRQPTPLQDPMYEDLSSIRIVGQLQVEM